MDVEIVKMSLYLTSRKIILNLIDFNSQVIFRVSFLGKDRDFKMLLNW